MYSYSYSYSLCIQYLYKHCPTYGNAHVCKIVTVVWMCEGTLATEAKTSGKYHHFQLKFFVFKGPATITRSHRNRKCSSTGKNGKGNCGKMLHFIEHLNVRGGGGGGGMRCNREDPDAVHNTRMGLEGYICTIHPSKHTLPMTRCWNYPSHLKQTVMKRPCYELLIQ